MLAFINYMQVVFCATSLLNIRFLPVTSVYKFIRNQSRRWNPRIGSVTTTRLDNVLLMNAVQVSEST